MPLESRRLREQRRRQRSLPPPRSLLIMSCRFRIICIVVCDSVFVNFVILMRTPFRSVSPVVSAFDSVVFSSLGIVDFFAAATPPLTKQMHQHDHCDRSLYF